MAMKSKHTDSESAGHTSNGTITNKSEAVRRTLAAGIVQPMEGVAYIKSRFGIEIGPQHFSAVKSNTMRKLGTPTVNTRFQPKLEKTPTRTSRANGEADLIASLETLKPLIDQFGPDKLKRLVDLLG
jgi:hypothetical protein